jgi:hypothetical protein
MGQAKALPQSDTGHARFHQAAREVPFQMENPLCHISRFVLGARRPLPPAFSLAILCLLPWTEQRSKKASGSKDLRTPKTS